MSVRLLLQQCKSATLKLPTDDVLEIGQGVVVFVCFNKTAVEENALKAAQLVFKVKLSEEEGEAKRKTTVDTGGDILVIPQATLGGKLKGNSVQYHNNIHPEQGKVLYDIFCDELEKKSELTIRRGEFGARQVVSMETNGPYSHCFDV